jgi:hypothetical protein
MAELSMEEKTLIASLEPILRRAVWSKSARVFEGSFESAGKWIEYPLRLPNQKNSWGDYDRIKLTPNHTEKEFFECYCAFGTNELHTGVALYRILRELKRRGLLDAKGFDRLGK